MSLEVAIYFYVSLQRISGERWVLSPSLVLLRNQLADSTFSVTSNTRWFAPSDSCKLVTDDLDSVIFTLEMLFYDNFTVT